MHFRLQQVYGGVDRTDQLLQPYEIARKSLKWYKKLAIHFLQLAMLNSFLLFKKDGGRKHFLEFQHDVISVLVFGQDNEAHHDIPREENVVRLTERHFVEQIPPTDTNRKHRRDAKSAKRRLSERKPTTTAQAAPAHQASITTHASEFTTQTLCIKPTLGKNDITLKHAVEILV